MADIITGFRVLISFALLFCPVFSTAFYMLYLIAGVETFDKGFPPKEKLKLPGQIFST